MKKHHWIGALVLLIVGYAIGANWPGAFDAIKGRFGGAAA